MDKKDIFCMVGMIEYHSWYKTLKVQKRVEMVVSLDVGYV